MNVSMNSAPSVQAPRTPVAAAPARAEAGGNDGDADDVKPAAASGPKPSISASGSPTGQLINVTA